MFFVSEEFLRKYTQGEEFQQTIDEAVKPGEGLFDRYTETGSNAGKAKSGPEGV